MKQRVLIAIAAILGSGAVGVAIALGAFSSDPGGGTDGKAAVPPVPRAAAGKAEERVSEPPVPRAAAGKAEERVSEPPVPRAAAGKAEERVSEPPVPRAAAGRDPAPAAEATLGHSPPVPTLPGQPRNGRYFAILELRRGAQVPLLASPGGRLIKSLGAHSEFGSPRVLAVARQKGSWLGVITPLLPNGELGWVHFDRAKLERYWTRYWLRVALAERKMELRYGGRMLGRYTVSVGAAGSDTPRGRFSITDALIYDDSPYYGCCALAMSGHQEHLPVGWLGGDRIAIHGTPGPVGYAASSGCIRATNETMRALFRRIPLGTPVFVRG